MPHVLHLPSTKTRKLSVRDLQGNKVRTLSDFFCLEHFFVIFVIFLGLISPLYNSGMFGYLLIYSPTRCVNNQLYPGSCKIYFASPYLKKIDTSSPQAQITQQYLLFAGLPGSILVSCCIDKDSGGLALSSIFSIPLQLERLVKT